MPRQTCRAVEARGDTRTSPDCGGGLIAAGRVSGRPDWSRHLPRGTNVFNLWPYSIAVQTSVPRRGGHGGGARGEMQSIGSPIVWQKCRVQRNKRTCSANRVISRVGEWLAVDLLIIPRHRTLELWWCCLRRCRTGRLPSSENPPPLT